MDFQAYNKILLCPKPIRNESVAGIPLGYSFQIKYPSYRGAFLSCIEALSFWVDGEAIPAGDVAFCLNGKQFLLDELPECFKEYWFVRTPATILVQGHAPLTPGAHTVRVFMRHRVPYTGYFGEYLVLDSDVTGILTTEEED